jgi:oxygen-independent coproporphyrinogen-3 oxidase
MQSTDPGVLRVLERTHTPGRPLQVVQWAREAGFEHVSLDLIYGTPGETDRQFADSLQAAIGSGVDHVSAYSLIVEPGTRMARQVRSGRLPMPAEDVLADRYLIADEMLSAAGLRWYEVSNWAAAAEARCRHNLAYWRGGDWWGVGPGAHSHVGGVRWWNVRHPTPYAEALAGSRSPAAGRETLTLEQRAVERVMLEVRTSAGLPLTALSDSARVTAQRAVDDKLLDASAYDTGMAVLTLSGRLLADRVVRDLIAGEE